MKPNYEFPVKIIGNSREDITTINQEPGQFEDNVNNLLSFLRFNFPFTSYPKGRVVVAIANLEPDGRYKDATIYKNGYMGPDEPSETKRFFCLREA